MKWSYELLSHFYSKSEIDFFCKTKMVTLESSSSSIIGDEFEVIQCLLPEPKLVFLPSVADRFKVGDKIIYINGSGKIASKTFNCIENTPVSWGYVLP